MWFDLLNLVYTGIVMRLSTSCRTKPFISAITACVMVFSCQYMMFSTLYGLSENALLYRYHDFSINLVFYCMGVLCLGHMARKFTAK